MKARSAVMALIASALLTHAAFADDPKKPVADESGDGVILLVVAVAALVVLGGGVVSADPEVPAGQ